MSTTDVFRAVRFLWLIATATAVLSQESPVKICLTDEDRNRTLNVTLACPSGTVIAVSEAFFGRNQWGLCYYTDNDCTVDIDSFESCNGKNQCTRVFTGIYTQKCLYSTFLTVIYDCEGGTIQTPPTPGNPTYQPPSDNSDQTSAPTVPKHVLRVPSWDPVVTPKTNDDTALIAGCAVAVIITVTVLIIAIILVVRRLVGLRQDGNNQSPKKRNVISVLICTKLGCAMASCHDPDPEEGGRIEPPAPELDEEEDEGRVTPLGADAVDVVQELGRPDVTSADQGTPASTSGSSEIHHTQSSQREDRQQNEHLQQTSDESSTRGTQQINTSRNSGQLRMDAVAIPNTELSTLC